MANCHSKIFRTVSARPTNGAKQIRDGVPDTGRWNSCICGLTQVHKDVQSRRALGLGQMLFSCTVSINCREMSLMDHLLRFRHMGWPPIIPGPLVDGPKIKLSTCQRQGVVCFAAFSWFLTSNVVSCMPKLRCNVGSDGAWEAKSQIPQAATNDHQQMLLEMSLINVK